MQCQWRNSLAPKEIMIRTAGNALLTRLLGRGEGQAAIHENGGDRLNTRAGEPRVLSLRLGWGTGWSDRLTDACHILERPLTHIEIGQYAQKARSHPALPEAAGEKYTRHRRLTLPNC